MVLSSSASARASASARDSRGAALLALALALALALVAPENAHAQDLGLPIGTAVESVMVEDLDGNAVPVATSIGTKPVLLEFWATWCSVCAELEPEMHRVQDEFGADVEVVVVAVGVNQNARRIRGRVEDSPVAGRLVFDRRGAATRAFMAPATSYVVILDASGRVAYTGQGADQDLTAAVARVLGR